MDVPCFPVLENQKNRHKDDAARHLHPRSSGLGSIFVERAISGTLPVLCAAVAQSLVVPPGLSSHTRRMPQGQSKVPSLRGSNRRLRNLITSLVAGLAPLVRTRGKRVKLRIDAHGSEPPEAHRGWNMRMTSMYTSGNERKSSVWMKNFPVPIVLFQSRRTPCSDRLTA